MAATETDYASLRRMCIHWAEMADTQDAFEAFLALAETWKLICELEQPAPKRAARPADLMLQNGLT